MLRSSVKNISEVQSSVLLTYDTRLQGSPWTSGEEEMEEVEMKDEDEGA